jgi:DNA repair protein RadC
MKLKEMPVWELPREKVINNGIETVSSIDLLAILLRCGTKNKSVIDLSIEVLNKIDNLNDLTDLTIEEFISIEGIGIAKATTIVAALELGKRINSQSISKEKLVSPKDIFNFFKPLCQDLKQEHIYAVYIDAKGHFIKHKLISIGGLNNSFIDEKSVFKWAYKCSAAAIILIHNHPSGDPTPSYQDIVTTRRLIAMADKLDMILLDHVIIGEKYFSMKEKLTIFENK